MKTKFLSLIIALIALVSVNSAVAQNLHFIKGPTIKDNGTTLTVSGSIAGLGNNQNVTISIEADAVVTTTCTNPGGNIAPGQTKNTTVDATGTFSSDKNGRVNFSLTTTTPSPGECPNGKWTGAVSNVSFTNVVVKVNGVVVQ